MKRIVYKNPPLDEVILQVKFPVDLRLNDDPKDFQENVKSDFPFYKMNIDNEQEISLFPNQVNLPPVFRNISSTKNHTFISKDGKDKINLTNSFISLSTLQYERWEIFFAKFKNLYQVFKGLYAPSVIDRIGLRYKDVYVKEKHHLEDKKWADLIASPWIGALTSNDEDKVSASNVTYELLLEEGVKRRVVSGLGMKNGKKCFFVDSDFTCTMIDSVDNYEDVCNKLHDHSTNFYQSVVTKTLKDAMGIKEEIE